MHSSLPPNSQETTLYDADGNRVSKSVTSGGFTSTVKDVYQLGHLAYQTDGSGTLLASFTYDESGAPVSVQVGSDPSTSPMGATLPGKSALCVCHGGLAGARRLWYTLARRWGVV